MGRIQFASPDTGLVTKLVLSRIEPQRFPHLIEAEAEDVVQRIGDAWGKVANMPPGADICTVCTIECSVLLCDIASNSLSYVSSLQSPKLLQPLNLPLSTLAANTEKPTVQ